MMTEGSVLNTRYHLDRKIGQGGFAQVFLATDQLLKRRIAVKILNSDLIEDASFVGRFEREAQSVASLDHPNILAIYDYGQAFGTAYLVMPFVEGGTLHDLLKRDKKLTLQQTGQYLNQAAAALDYAHRRNVVHRDIKPQNMLLRQEDDRLLLADFGIARVLSPANAHNRTGVLGTISYMAPEQLEGSIGFGVDIYALGCVLFQMLTGELPYTGTTEAVMMGHVLKPIPSIIERSRGQLPAALQGVIERALAKRPQDRYQTASELAQAYAMALADAPKWSGEATGVVRPTEASRQFNQPPTEVLAPPVVPIIPPTPIPPARTQTTPTYDRSQSGTGVKQSQYMPLQVYNSPPPPTPPDYQTRSQYSPPGGYSTGPHEPPRKRLNLGLIGGVLAILAVALAVIVLLLLAAPKKQQASNVPTATNLPLTTESSTVATTTVATTVAPTTNATTTTNAPVATTPATTTPTIDPVAVGLKAANDSYYVKGDFNGGITAFRNLSLDYPSNAKVWRDYGNALRYWNRNADGSGLVQLEKAVALDPKDSLTYLYLTDTYADNYRYDDALKAAKTAYQLDPNGWYGHAALMISYRIVHDNDNARAEADAMQKAVGAASNDPLYNTLLAEFLSSQNDYKLGLAANDQALAVWPNVPSLLNNKAILLLNSADARERGEEAKKQVMQNALTLLQQAQKVAPQSTPVLTALSGYHSIFSKDNAEATKYAQQALASNDNDAEAHRVNGLVLSVKKDYANAIKEYARCTDLDKYNTNCYLESSDNYLLQAASANTANKPNDATNAYKAALSRAQEAVSHDTKNHVSYFYVGLCYTQLKDYNNAITNLQKAISINPNYADSYGWLGFAYLYNNQREEAQAAYNKGITLDPNNQTLKNLGDRLKK